MAGKQKTAAVNTIALYDRALAVAEELYGMMPHVYKLRGPDNEENICATWHMAVRDFADGVLSLGDLAHTLADRAGVAYSKPFPGYLMGWKESEAVLAEETETALACAV